MSIVIDILNNLEIMPNISIIDSDYSDEQKQTEQYRTPKIIYIIEPAGVKFEEAKRVIAIAHSYDDKNVKYGASIFRKVYKTDICVKSQIRDTAIDRFNINPVCFTLSNTSEIDNKLKYDDIIKQIRYKMYKYGVKGRDVIYNSLTNQNDNLSLDSCNIGKIESNHSDSLPEKESNHSDSLPEIESNHSDNNLVEIEPRISYILEPKGSTWENAKRIIAIVYSYSDNKISYGACIFRRDYKGEACVKANIRVTAFERFNNYPICLEKKNSDNKISVVQVLNLIRKTIHKVGVRT